MPCTGLRAVWYAGYGTGCTRVFLCIPELSKVRQVHLTPLGFKCKVRVTVAPHGAFRSIKEEVTQRDLRPMPGTRQALKEHLLINLVCITANIIPLRAATAIKWENHTQRNAAKHSPPN